MSPTNCYFHYRWICQSFSQILLQERLKKLKSTSSNCFFYPTNCPKKPNDSSWTVRHDEENQQILKYTKLEPVSGHRVFIKRVFALICTINRFIVQFMSQIVRNESLSVNVTSSNRFLTQILFIYHHKCHWKAANYYVLDAGTNKRLTFFCLKHVWNDPSIIKLAGSFVRRPECRG